MKPYQEEFARFLAENGALFFKEGLRLKDGRPTPYFVNTGVFKTASQITALGKFYAELVLDKFGEEGFDVFFGPSYKGSMLAQTAATELFHNHDVNKAFEYDRKEAKTHGDASAKKKMFVTGAFYDGARIILVDDVATSMATKYEALEKIASEASRQEIDLSVVGIVIAVDREQTGAVYQTPGDISSVVLDQKGEDAIRTFTQEKGIPVHAIAGITDIVTYLHREGIPVLQDGVREPLTDERLAQFVAYLETYGATR